MADTFPKLEFLKVWQSSAVELINARVRSNTIHRTKDIRAAGDEVEQKARELIANKLPRKYYVGHGHIVDYCQNTSPQYDIIISDIDRSPVLFRTNNETEYFTYESVYAVGEIKSTYYKSENYIQSFVDNIKGMKKRLYRKNIPLSSILPSGQIQQLIGEVVGASFIDLDAVYKNPLLSFLLFVDSGDFAFEQLASLYKSAPPSDLPNIVCLLDRGIIVNMHMEQNGYGEMIPVVYNTVPEFNNKTSDQQNNWGLLVIREDDFRHGANLAALYYLLHEHLQSVELALPQMTAYLTNILNHKAFKYIKD